MDAKLSPWMCYLVIGFTTFLSTQFVLVMLNLIYGKLDCYENAEYVVPTPPHIMEVEDIPVIVTAAHEHNFDQSIKMLQTVLVNLTFQHPGLSVIFYDTGLTEEQNDTLFYITRDATVDIRRFPFTEYPTQLQRVNSGAIKPVILRQVLSEYNFVMWVGPGLRFHSPGSLKLLFDFSRSASSGLVALDSTDLLKGKATADLVKHSVRDEPIYYEYAREINTDWLVITRATAVMETIIKPWVRCAVKRKCFFSKQTLLAHPCKDTHAQTGSDRVRRAEADRMGCDIDRSVLSVILYKIHDGCTAAYTFSPTVINYNITICI